MIISYSHDLTEMAFGLSVHCHFNRSTVSDDLRYRGCYAGFCVSFLWWIVSFGFMFFKKPADLHFAEINSLLEAPEPEAPECGCGCRVCECRFKATKS